MLKFIRLINLIIAKYIIIIGTFIYTLNGYAILVLINAFIIIIINLIVIILLLIKLALDWRNNTWW
jgi:hypothetical protein